MFASWFASIDISENKDITFIELQQFLTRSIVGKNIGKYKDRTCTKKFKISENDDLSKEEKRELKRQVRPMARGIFLRMDKNRDGTITLGAFTRTVLPAGRISSEPGMSGPVAIGTD